MTLEPLITRKLVLSLSDSWSQCFYNLSSYKEGVFMIVTLEILLKSEKFLVKFYSKTADRKERFTDQDEDTL